MSICIQTHIGSCTYDDESLSYQPTSILVKIELSYFYVIKLKTDALSPTIVQCHKSKMKKPLSFVLGFTDDGVNWISTHALFYSS